MNIDEQLIKVLHEKGDDFISGEELAEHLGVTRTAIWNHVSRLREIGYTIDALPHLGYRLSGIPDKMLPDEIRNVLGTEFIGNKIYAFDKTDSTNDIASRLAEGGEPEGALVVAEQQGKGRGRLGRSWFSPKGKGLWFSLVLRPELPPSAAPQVTLAGAVACAKAVRVVAGVDALIKWPNDVVVNNRKVCGILTEMNTDMDRIRHVVMGIGMNVNVDDEEFPYELKSTATSVKIEAGKAVSRLALLASVLHAFEALYVRLKQGDFESVKQEWIGLSNIVGKFVRVAAEGRTLEGYAVGVDFRGNLIVRLANGLNEYVISGDVRIIEK